MTRPSTGMLLWGAFASLVGFLALTAAVTLDWFDGVDHVARLLLHRPGHPMLHSSMEAASFLGGHPGQTVAVCLGSFLLWQRRRRCALALPMIMAGAGLLQFVAKWMIDRPRPNLDPLGFPSAHVLSLVVLLGYLAWLVATSRTRAGWRGWSLAACGAGVGTVALSRMYLDAHWFSDVLGGLTIGLAYLLLAIWLSSRLEAKGHASGHERSGVDVDSVVPAV